MLTGNNKVGQNFYEKELFAAARASGVLQQTVAHDGAHMWQTIIKKTPLELQITESKPFLFNESNAQWMWYKNLVLPSYSVALQGTDDQVSRNFNIDLVCYKVLEDDGEEPLQRLEMFATCATSAATEHRELRFPEKNSCKFSGLRLPESFNGEKNIHFIVALIAWDSQSNQLQIACVTQPICILARRKLWLRKKNISTHFEPFLPDNLDKVFEQVHKTKGQKTPLSDDFDSLYHFFCNPYIRHKIIHPVFLKLRFPKALHLYYNVQRVQHFQDSQVLISLIILWSSIFKAIQREINRALIEQSEYSECPLEFERTLIVVLNPGHEDRAEKIFKYLKVLIGPIVSIFTKAPHGIPEHYAELEFNPKMRIQYKKEYNDLQKLKFEHMSQKQNYEVTRKSDEQIRSQSFFADRQKTLGTVISIGGEVQQQQQQQQHCAQSLQALESHLTSAKRLQCDSVDSSTVTVQSKQGCELPEQKGSIQVFSSDLKAMSQGVPANNDTYYPNVALPMNSTFLMTPNPYLYYQQQQAPPQQQMVQSCFAYNQAQTPHQTILNIQPVQSTGMLNVQAISTGGNQNNSSQLCIQQTPSSMQQFQQNNYLYAQQPQYHQQQQQHQYQLYSNSNIQPVQNANTQPQTYYQGGYVQQGYYMPGVQSSATHYNRYV